MGRIVHKRADGKQTVSPQFCYAVNKEKRIKKHRKQVIKNPWKSLDFHGFLVEAAGLEGGTEALKAFISKDFSVCVPHYSPKTIIHFSECHQCLLNEETNKASGTIQAYEYAVSKLGKTIIV